MARWPRLLRPHQGGLKEPEPAEPERRAGEPERQADERIMTGQALRIIFRHDEEGVTLKSADRVDMRIPPAEGADHAVPSRTVGLFAELRSGDGTALFTTPLADDDARALEYPTGDPDQPFGRTLSPGPVFVSVLLPAHADARSVALVRAEMARFIPFFPWPRRRVLGVFDLPGEGDG